MSIVPAAFPPNATIEELVAMSAGLIPPDLHDPDADSSPATQALSRRLTQTAPTPAPKKG